jgi:hypothetical protein
VFETHFDQFNDLSLYNSETKMPLWTSMHILYNYISTN